MKLWFLSFWEDGQRLTDSWYGIEKVLDGGYDEICLQALSKVENSLNHADNDAAAPAAAAAAAHAAAADDDDDDLCIQEVSNAENKNFNNSNIMNVNMVIDDDDVDFDEEFDKIVENYQY